MIFYLSPARLSFSSSMHPQFPQALRSSSFLIVGFIIKPSVDKIRFDYVYKGPGIYLGNLFYKKLGLFAGDNRIDHGSIITAVAAGSVQPCGRVMRQFGNFFINLIRMSGDNK